MIADRTGLARQLREQVIAYLNEHAGQWVPFEDLLALAPEGRQGEFLDDTVPYGSDPAAGPAADAGPSGQPDSAMLSNVTSGLCRDMLIESRYPLEYRLHDPAAPVGLKEIAGRLGTKRGTVDRWRDRGVLPEPTWPSVGGRPAWRWGLIRDWAIETGRHRYGDSPDMRMRPFTWVVEVYEERNRAWVEAASGTEEYAAPARGEDEEKQLAGRVMDRYLTAGLTPPVRVTVSPGTGRVRGGDGMAIEVALPPDAEGGVWYVPVPCLNRTTVRTVPATTETDQ